MSVYELIKKKRDGQELNYEELHYLVSGYNQDVIPDYQISAFLMAVYFNGMSAEETHALTKAMLESGQVIDLSDITGIKVDKHSSGGVADTITLVVAPIAAAGGVHVAKMSGRGLGHTGGTIDKLESIPDFKTEISMHDFIMQVNTIGLAVAAQTANLAPADKKMYALRDVTATVDSLPLIAASIMSKKLASGADAIVLDVKTGSGAFMKNPKQARKLAEMMVAIGKQANKKILAYVTDMNQPLGQAVGNSLEIIEALETLQGKGPERLTELSIKIAGSMLMLGGIVQTQIAGEKYAFELLQSGRALSKFKEFIRAQGGNEAVCEDYTLLPQAPYSKEYLAQHSGYLSLMDAEAIGIASVKLGAGRMLKDAPIDHAAGITVLKSIGDFVNKGDILCRLFSSNESTFIDAEANLQRAFTFLHTPTETPRLIYDILT